MGRTELVGLAAPRCRLWRRLKALVACGAAIGVAGVLMYLRLWP